MDNLHKIPKKLGVLDFAIMFAALSAAVIISAFIFLRPEPQSYDELVITYTVQITGLPETDNNVLGTVIHWDIREGSAVHLYLDAPGESSRGEMVGRISEIVNGDGAVVTFKIEAGGYFAEPYYNIATEKGSVKIVGNEKISLCGENFIFAGMTVIDISAVPAEIEGD